MLVLAKDARELSEEIVVEEEEGSGVAMTSFPDVGCAVGSFVWSTVGDSVWKVGLKVAGIEEKGKTSEASSGKAGISVGLDVEPGGEIKGREKREKNLIYYAQGRQREVEMKGLTFSRFRK